MSNPVRMYFHFRSPYSWLGTERLVRDPIAVEAIPFSGVPKSLKVDGGGGNSARLNYIVEDVARLTGKLGLTIAFPNPFDTDWVRPNAAYWRAEAEGQGFPFMVAAFRARWSYGKDLGDPAIIADVASSIGLPAEMLTQAMDDVSWQDKARTQEARAEEDGVCGVPFFIYEGQKFWGQDRIADLREAMANAAQS